MSPDSGAFWVRQLAEQRIHKTQLTPRQRRLCVQFLLAEFKYTRSEIGEIVGCHRNQVHNIEKRLKKYAAQALDALDQREVALDLITTAEVVCARLMRDGKSKDAWTVRRELVESLQSLGYISREPLQIDASMRLTIQELIALVAGDPAADRAAAKNGFHENGQRPSLEGPAAA